ncbi:hypothetical protein SRB5_11280 [Streptomyces sp. RB5]|uniref:AMP-binding enzyme C-terminal domain-containing protein n=1 Tax=Streptomyces smaragdinus TaxID=2585196 RepID=A0A7K0CE16_9ACTN|nr:hypothetical protein [Streptomyces smaragdinus]MQY11014.1 hypothetical protein [Streptomyces smaragdinus]
MIGRPHPALGEEPAAYVTLHAERDITPGELRELCAADLTKVTVPVGITILAALPMNKPALRAQTTEA